MKNQLHVGTKADLSFNLRHFWPMKLFRWPRLQRKMDCHFKISGAVHTWENWFIQKITVYYRRKAKIVERQK